MPKAKPTRTAPSREPTPDGGRLGLWTLIALAIAVLAGAMALIGTREYSRALTEATDLSQRRAERLAQDLAQSLVLARLAIAQTEARLAQLPAGAGPGGLARLLGDEGRERVELLARLPLPFQLHALGAEGHPLQLAPGVHRHGEDAHAHVHPLPPAGAPGRWLVGLTQGAAHARVLPLVRAAAPNAHGVVAFAADFDHAALLRRLESSAVRGGGAALFRIEPDGSTTLLAREPFREAELGQRVHGSLAQRLARGPSGVFDAVTLLDGVHRLVAFRRLEADADELVVAYGLSREAILAGWREQLPAAVALMLLLSAAMLWGGWRLDRAWLARARAGAALAAGEQRLRTLTDNLPDVVVRFDRAGRHLFANAAVERATGLPPQAFIGKTHAELGMPADRVTLWSACLQRVFAGGRPEQLEFDDPGPAGLRYWESQVVPEPPLPGGEPTVLVISRDITERKAAQQALQLSEQRLREAQQLASIGSWALDLGSGALAWSDEVFRIFELDPARFEADYAHFLATIHPDDRAAVDQAWQTAVAEHGDYAIAHRLLLPDGRVKHVQERGRCSYADHGTPLRALGTVQDITARVQAEQALRDNEERLRLALQAAQQGLYDLDLRTGDAVVSPEYATMLGHDPAHFHETNAAWRERLHPDDRPQVEQAYLDYVAGRRADYRVEFRQRLRDGGWKWILSIGRIQERDAEGQPLRMLGTHTDLTAIKETQAALQDSEARFRVLFDASPVPTLAYERGSLRLLAVNEAFTRLSGYSRDEALALRIPDLYPPEMRAAMVELAARVQGLNHITDIQYVCKDGRRIDVETRSHDFAVDGRPARISVIVDVTEQRRAEAERRAAAERFRKLFEAAPEAISVSAFDSGRFLQVNDAFCELFGHTREQAVGRTSLDLQMWTDVPARETIVQRLRAGEPVQGFEGVARRGDGQAVDVLFSAERIEFGGQEALLLMFRDISERKRLDAALRTSQARLAHLLSRAPTVVYTASADGAFATTYFSPNLPNLLGWQPQDFVGNSSFWLGHVHPDDRDALLQQMDTLAGRDELVLEYRFQHADGRWRWMRDHVSLQRDEQGAAVELVGAWIDITERREAEEQVRRLAAELEQRVQERTAQLEQSEARYRTIFETVPISIGEEDWSAVQGLLRDLRRQGVSDAAGYFATRPDFARKCLRAVRVRRLNRKALALHDAHDKDTDLPDLQAVYPRPDDLLQFVGELEAMWAGQRLFTAKRSLPSVSGRPLSLMMTMSLPGLDDDDGTALVCLVDITEIDRLNAELDLSVARLREVNRELETFTYSVSHDLKAPLRGIDGYSRLLLAEQAERLDDEGRQFLAHIRHATQHMGALIDDLLAYSRLERRALALAALPLGPLVDAALSGLRGDLQAAGAQLELALDPALRLHGDAQGLTMALRNLVDNALKFSRQRTPPHIRVAASRTAGGVALSVTDNGVGFDMKFHDRIFAIFQRLHRAEDYPGTGVGLAIVRKAVERMGGRVWATSQPGEGSCFTIELPEANTP